MLTPLQEIWFTLLKMYKLIRLATAQIKPLEINPTPQVMARSISMVGALPLIILWLSDTSGLQLAVITDHR
jgi:hypothetical protein